MGMNAYTFMPIIGIYACIGIYYLGISFMPIGINVYIDMNVNIGINVYIGINAYIGIYAYMGIYAYTGIYA